MQPRHAALAFGIHARKHGLGTRHGHVVHMADEFFGRLPGLVFGLAHDDVQADAELHGAPMLCSTGAHVGHLLGHFGRRLAPGQVGLDLLGGEVVGGVGRPPKVHRRVRLLQGRKQQLGALHAEVLAVVVERFTAVAARKDLAPDADELGGLLVARGVVQKHAVALQLGLVAPSHQVDEQSPAREPVERGGHARGQRGLMQAGAHGHQELEFLGHGNQAGCNHPGVFARAPGGNQNTLVAQAVGGHRHLLEVVMAELARAFGGAKVAAVAVGGNEPEDLHGTGLFKAGSQRGPYGVSKRWQSRTGARAGPRVAAAGSAPRRRP